MTTYPRTIGNPEAELANANRGNIFEVEVRGFDADGVAVEDVTVTIWATNHRAAATKVARAIVPGSTVYRDRSANHLYGIGLNSGPTGLFLRPAC